MLTTSTDPYAPPSKGSEAKQLCYISTPKHVNSFIGCFIYIYTGKGTLDLTPKSLVFTYRNGALMEIALNTIVKLERGSYSRVAKPFGLDFIAVTSGNGHHESTIYLTPTRSALPGLRTSCFQSDSNQTNMASSVMRPVAPLEFGVSTTPPLKLVLKGESSAKSG